jgi:uncharacterized DUF497 family protein
MHYVLPEIGFDVRKSERNEAERGFGFLFAARIFLGRTVEALDLRRDYGEERVLAFGQIEGRMYAVVYTWRTAEDGMPMRWIISARRANERERRNLAGRFD